MSNHYDGPEIALVPGTIRAYRVWRLLGGRRGAPELGSMFMVGHSWERGMNTAACNATPFGDWTFGVKDHFHGKGCYCGFYGLHQPTWTDCFWDRFDFTKVRGVFRASGRVVIGNTGIRAEKGEIEALLVTGPHLIGRRRALREHYGVPVYSNEKAFLKAYPPIESDLIPKQPERLRELDLDLVELMRNMVITAAEVQREMDLP